MGKRNDNNNNHGNGTTTNTTEITSSFYNGTLVGMNLYHAAIDPEGSTMAMGWDMNLDGSIDIPVSTNSGFTTINILGTTSQRRMKDFHSCFPCH